MQNSFSSTITRNNNFRPQPTNVRFSQNECDTKSMEAIRQSLISEFQAISLYDNWINQLTNENAKKVFKELREEETIHVGELLALMEIICPEKINLFNMGKEEVLKIIGNNSMNFKQ